MNKKSESFFLSYKRKRYCWIIGYVFVFTLFTFPLYPQITIRINNQTIRQALRTIENHTTYRFFYATQLQGLDKKVSVEVNNGSIEVLMDQLLDGTGLIYEKKENDQIYLATTGISRTASLEMKKISGVVKDGTGEPVIGANVFIKGTTNGTTTDIDGAFMIEVAVGEKISVTYVGFIPREITIGSQDVYTIVLAESNQNIEEVVVIGYGTQKRANLTGSVSTLKSERITVAPVANVTNTLGGQLPGVLSVQKSGEPGVDGASITIRGFGNALVIVDGVESGLSNLDPNEIENITVLKDGAAAIYGSRAGNGVILVTTKRGKMGKPTIHVNSTFSWQSVTRIPKVMNASQFSDLIREAQLNSGTPENAMMFSEEDVRKYHEGREPGYQGWDWWKATIKDMAPMQQHNVSLSGGNEQFRYNAFLGYTDQAGMYRSRDNKMQRYNMRVNVDGNVNKHLSVSLDMSVITTDLNRPSRDQESLWIDLYAAYPTLRPNLPDPSKIGWTGNIASPIAGTTSELGGYNKGLTNQLFATFSTTYNLPVVKGLSFKGLVNYNQTTNENKSWGKHYMMYLYDEQGDRYTPQPSAFNTLLNESYSRGKTITGQISVNYDRTFNEKHSVTGLALIEMMDYYSKWFSAGRGDYITDSIDQLFAGGADSQTSNGSASESGRVSYVGRVNYGYLGKYLAEATVRYDGSPKFPGGSRWGFFPSFSAGWRLSEEGFIKDRFRWLDNLKLRAGISSSGYDGIGDFQYLTGYRYGSRYVVDQTAQNGLVSTGLANPFITWEKMRIYNVGLDFSLLTGKLYGELDLFYRDRFNMLGSRASSMPNTFGSRLPDENINSMTNRGIELLLGHTARYGDVLINISGNVSWARAKWKHYDEPEYTDPDDIRINKVSGNWANRYFGYQSDGLFTSQEEIDNWALDQDLQGNKTLQPGDIKYIDQNNDGVLDWRDRVQIGLSNDPEMMFGLNVGAAWKGFDFSAFFQGAARRSLYVFTGIETIRNNNALIYQERWTEQNNDPDALIPRQYVGGKSNNGQTSDFWLKDASYLRLKTLSIGYNLPKAFLSKLLIEHMRIYVSGTNLFTISGLNKYDVDPEGQGVANYYPQQRVFSVGLNLKF